jgi:hypothetical protein
MRPERFARSIAHQFIQSVSAVVFSDAQIQPIRARCAYLCWLGGAYPSESRLMGEGLTAASLLHRFAYGTYAGMQRPCCTVAAPSHIPCKGRMLFCRTGSAIAQQSRLHEPNEYSTSLKCPCLPSSRRRKSRSRPPHQAPTSRREATKRRMWEPRPPQAQLKGNEGTPRPGPGPRRVGTRGGAPAFRESGPQFPAKSGPGILDEFCRVPVTRPDLGGQKPAC